MAINVLAKFTLEKIILEMLKYILIFYFTMVLLK